MVEQLSRHFYHDEVEALQRSWTPRLDGRRQDIVYEGRPLLIDGRAQVADDVSIRLVADKVADILLYTDDSGHYREYRVFPLKNSFILGLGSLIRGIKEGLTYMGRGAE